MPATDLSQGVKIFLGVLFGVLAVVLLAWLASYRWDLRAACQSCDDECGSLYYYNNYDGRGWRPNTSLIRAQPRRRGRMRLRNLEEQRGDEIDLEDVGDAGSGGQSSCGAQNGGGGGEGGEGSIRYL